MEKLRGKVSIVTGAGRGIGRAISLRFAEEGAHIVVVDINKDKAEETANQVKDLRREALAITADVRSRKDIENVVDKTIKTFGRIDILCNNAGILPYPQHSILDVSEEIWNNTMDVNVKGVLLTTQVVANQMIKQGEGGKIVNIASLAGKRGNKITGHYCASKAAVINLTQSFALALAEHNINVNAVNPGVVNTPMLEEEKREMQAHNIPDFYPALIENTPLKKMEEPEDIANVVLFLASSDADLMTGQNINVTGGLCMY